MCTGVEMLLAAAGTAAASKIAINAMTPKPPAVTQQSPLADQAKIDADAAAKAAQARTDRRRRQRGSSLMATMGGGDTTDPMTGQPTAIGGKSTLGGM